MWIFGKVHKCNCNLYMCMQFAKKPIPMPGSCGHACVCEFCASGSGSICTISRSLSVWAVFQAPYKMLSVEMCILYILFMLYIVKRPFHNARLCKIAFYMHSIIREFGGKGCIAYLHIGFARERASNENAKTYNTHTKCKNIQTCAGRK